MFKPEEHGLVLVGEVVGADYEWSSLHVFKRITDGRLFQVEDSGCSCNGPLEYADYVITELKPLDDPLPVMCPVPDVSEEEWNRLAAAVRRERRNLKRRRA